MSYAANFVPTQYFREPRPREPDPIVTRHTRNVEATYKEKSGAPAMVELSKLMRDPTLTATQRTDLMAQLRPVTDEIATELGRNARRTDLPASGKSDASKGIDDQKEYQLTL